MTETPFGSAMREGGDSRPYVSLVIPVFNESAVLADIHARAIVALDSMEREYELIYVDDSSTDNTLDMLRDIHDKTERVTVISLLRNFGQLGALSCGICHASGDVVVTMDGDGQMDPADVPVVVKKVEDGYDVVSGWRVNRRDSWFSRALPSKMANAVLRRLAERPIHDYGCSLKGYRRTVIEAFGFDHYHIYNYTKLMWLADKSTEVPVKHFHRAAGPSKWSLYGLFGSFMEYLVSLTMYAFRTVAVFGGLTALLGVILVTLVYLLADKRALLNLAVYVNLILSLIGIGTLSALGVLAGEFLLRTYQNVDHLPKWWVREILPARTHAAQPATTQTAR